MAKVLFVNAGSEGHVNPTIGVVQELVSRGEEVVYFCMEAYRERIEKAGAAVRTIDDQKFIKAFISGGREHVLERVNGLLLTADIVIPTVLEQIEGEQYDYVIHDSMFGCGRIIAQILKLPAICSCTTFALNQSSFNQIMEPNIAPEISTPIRNRYESLTAMLKDKYGLDIRSPYEVMWNPAPLTIVYTTREFQPGGEAFDASYKFVGPSISERPKQESFDFRSIEGRAPIYISLGTVFNQAVDFYKLCMEALGSINHPVVMSVGSRTRISDLGEIPNNFIVQGYVPQTEILQHAKLFITHGGMNSTHEALYHGVPLIVIPQGADQPVIAEQVAHIGAGIPLQMQGLTAVRLNEAVNQVLSEPSFLTRAAKMGESLRRSGGYQLAAKEIVDYIRQREE